MHQPKAILVIMDGWGYSPIEKGNAILDAKTPTFDYLWKNYAHTLLNAFGENVGLPWGNIGSSEVGHTSIGSGKLVFQELLKVDQAMKEGEFSKNKVFSDFIIESKKNGRPIHLVGLVSNGGVHSHIDHLFKILDSLNQSRVGNEVFIHVITDGRDTSPESATQFLDELNDKIIKLDINVKISTVAGRFFAMDRDNRWDRTKKYYLAITQGIGEKSSSAKDAIEKQYKEKNNDEFINPVVLDLSKSNQSSWIKSLLHKKTEASVNKYDGLIHNLDNVFFFNIRSDRMRQILEMFLFPKNEIGTKPTKANIITMITYNEFFPVKVVFPSEIIRNPLAKIFSDYGLKQGHFAETEKYAHVTYFFNGGNSTPYKDEIWEMVHSPNVKTYDLKPEMSADGVTAKLMETVEQKKLDFVLVNYANCDMVGHTGVYDKVIIAVETVDKQLKKLTEAFPESYIFITADHGNAEQMIHPETGEIDKKHTVNPVPFILVHKDFRIEPKATEILQPSGILADIAPTILELSNMKKVPEMNGISLVPLLRESFTKKEDSR